MFVLGDLTKNSELPCRHGRPVDIGGSTLVHSIVLLIQSRNRQHVPGYDVISVGIGLQEDAVSIPPL